MPVLTKMESVIKCECGCVDEMLKNVKEIEADEALDCEEGGCTPSLPNFGTHLNDQLVFKWMDESYPWNSIEECPVLKQLFVNLINTYKTGENKQLFRGTDYAEYKNLKVGDIIDYSNRYSSWTPFLHESVRFTDPQNPILLRYNGTINALDISKVDRHINERIVPYNKFVVTKAITFNANGSNIDQLKDHYEAAFAGDLMKNGSNECKLYYVDLVD